MPALPLTRAYHLIPAGASKLRAVARHMQGRGHAREDCIALGDSREDLDVASVVDAFWLVANAVEDDPELVSEAARPGARIASELYGAGVVRGGGDDAGYRAVTRESATGHIRRSCTYSPARVDL